MSRRREGGLPAIRAPYDDGGYITPRESRALSRIDVLEDRLNYQERTTQALIDRAFKIKEDVVNSLNLTHGTWHEEKQARNLLQEHIRTITEVVKKLSRDIVVLEQHIQMKGGALDGASNALKSLEINQVASLTDLRGRVARCDASMAKLAADLKLCYDTTKSATQSHQDFSNRTTDHIQRLEAKVADLSMKMERSSLEQTMKLQHVEGDSSQHLATLDNKTRSLIDDLHKTLNHQRAQDEAHREKLEHRLMAVINNHIKDIATRQDKFEAKTEEALSVLKQKLSTLEEEMKKEREKNQQAQVAMSSKLQGWMEGQLRRQKEEMQRLKKECREGFSTIHESIGSMKQVNDGKRKLLEEQLRKEISQIRKMVVLV